MTRRLRHPLARAAAGTLAAFAGFSMTIQVARGGPADVLLLDRPGASGVRPEAAPVTGNEYSVSGQTGSFQYSYPIAVPPGRHGAQPSLALSYSSQGSIYGGIASHWSLSLPEIAVDTSEGTLKYANARDWTEEAWTSSMAGGQRLVWIAGATGPTSSQVGRYVAEHDSSYALYERHSDGSWTVRVPSGDVYRFGEPRLLGGHSNDKRALLTSSTSAKGNTIEYRWRTWSNGIAREAYLDRIDYGGHARAGIGHFARVRFEYAPIGRSATCTRTESILPVGARLDYRTGTPELFGAHKLLKIVAEVRNMPSSSYRRVREVALGYDVSTEACGNRHHAPHRRLLSIQETGIAANGKATTLPKLSFQYGDPLGNRPATVPFEFGPEPLDSALASGFSPHINLPRIRRTAAIHAMLLDLDGDSILDRVESPGARRGCVLHWYRGTGSGFETTRRTTGLPMLATSGLTPESCGIEGQYTRVRTPGMDFSFLERESHGCAATSHYVGTYNRFRFVDVTGDGAVDLVTSIERDMVLYDPYQDPSVANPPGCEAGDELAPETLAARSGPYLPGDNVPGDRVPGEPNPGDRTPDDWACFNIREHQRCGEDYVWRVYVNTGNGQFLPQPIVTRAPFELNGEGGDGAWGATPGVASSGSGPEGGILDIDGDGVADLVHRKVRNYVTTWRVWRGTGDGTFIGRDGTVGGEGIVWSVSGAAKEDARVSSSSTTSSTGYAASNTIATLADVNGDGLVDAVSCRELEPDDNCAGRRGSLVAYLNNGRGFVSTPIVLRRGAPLTSSAFASAMPGELASGDWDRFSELRLLDYDRDGRADLVARERHGGSSYRRVHWNRGDVIDTPPSTLSTYERLSDASDKATFNYAIDRGNRDTPPDLLGWAVEGDVLDLTGNGLPELVSGGRVVSQFSPAGNPPRLMAEIVNGRGRTTEIRYAPHNAYPAVAGRDMPTPVWVVASITTKDVSEQVADSSVSYEYRGPVYNQDDRGSWGFRGFDEVTTVTPSGSRSAAHYDYDLDWSGRLVRSVAYHDATYVHSIEDLEYGVFELYPDASGAARVRTYHVERSESRLCGAEQTLSACEGAIPRTSETEYEIRHAPATATPGLVLARETRTFAGETAGIDARKAVTTYHLGSQTDYRVLPKTVEALHLTKQGWLRHGFSERFYDERGNEIATETAVDGSLMARSEACFDATGSVRATRAPKDVQNAPREGDCFDGQRATRLEYDAWNVYPTISSKSVTRRETGEVLEHRYMTEVDLATGATTRQGGPYRDGRGWPGNSYEIDGFGRVTKTIRWTDNGRGPYRKVEVARTTYIDNEIPNRVETAARIDLDEDRWVRGDTTYAGTGHVLAETTMLAQGPATTLYYYNAEGMVDAVYAPNPAHDSGGTALRISVYNYDYDSIGRITRFTPPVGAAMQLQYDGRTTSRTEVGIEDDAVAMPVTLVSDVFGRLIEVHETADDGKLAITSYEYDANDNVHIIRSPGDDGDDPGVNPAGIETVLDHDYAGRRKAIHRGGRTWHYTYDLHGNMTAKVVPFEGSPSNVTGYLVTYAYDELDRLTTENASAADVPRDTWLRLGESDGITTYHYDDTSRPNGLGNLSRVELPHGELRYEYTAEGHTSKASYAFSVNPLRTAPVANTRSIETTYNALGMPTQVRHADGTLTLSEVDERGLPHTLKLWGKVSASSSFAWRTLATVDRGLSGVAVKRTAGSKLQVKWAYDANARVTATDISRLVCVRSAPPPVPGPIGIGLTQSTGTQRMRTSKMLGAVLRKPVTCSYRGAGGERVHWDDVGNVRSVSNLAHGHVLTYTYDSQHQLKTAESSKLAGMAAATGDTAYFASFEYFPDGRIRVVGMEGHNEEIVEPRHVTYRYASKVPGAELNDPAAVLKIEDAVAYAGSETAPAMADLDYDPRGNLTTRVVDGDEREFVYDVHGRLREAKHNEGTEYYFYDHNGQRLLAVRTPYNDEPARAKLWFGAAEIEYKPNGYTSSLTESETTAHLGLGGSPVAIVRNGQTHKPEYTFNGVLGSLLAVLDASGNTRATYSYGPFGELLESAGDEAEEYDRLYNGKVFDDLSGLSYYGYRYYDRFTLTWTTQDPMYRFAPDLAWDEPRRMGLYTFNVNNPIRYVDPDGLDRYELSSAHARDICRGIGCQPGDSRFEQARRDVTVAQAKGTGAGLAAAGIGLGGASVGGLLLRAALGAETAADVVNVSVAMKDVAANPSSRESLLGLGVALGDLVSGPNPGGELNTTRVANKREKSGGRGKNRVSDRVQGRPNGEQQALADMAKADSKRIARGKGPVSREDADAYVELGNEVGVPVRAKSSDLNGEHGYGPVPPGPNASHIHVNGEHVPVPPGYTPPAGSNVIQ